MAHPSWGAWEMGNEVMNAEPVALADLGADAPWLPNEPVAYAFSRWVARDTLHKRAIMLAVDDCAQLIHFGLSQAGL